MCTNDCEKCKTSDISETFSGEKVLLKRRLESDHYKSSGVISDSLIIAGPDVEDHIRQARSLVSRTKESKVYIVEICHLIHEDQKEKVRSMDGSWPTIDAKTRKWNGHLPYDHGVVLLRGNVGDYNKSFRFEDLDLMSASHFDIIFKRIVLQYSTFREDKKYRKAVVGTFSPRGFGGDERIAKCLSKIAEIAGAKIRFEFNSKWDYNAADYKMVIKKIKIDDLDRDVGIRSAGAYEVPLKIVERGRLVKMVVYFYNEGRGPMYSFLIVWR